MATTDKYDRQLRLWGPLGQKALSESHICCFNAGPTASESLKNLVLPGLGKFTIVDHKLIQASDLGNNFFVTPTDIGKPRAAVVTELLLELNSDVQGYARVQDPREVIVNEDPSFFKSFQLILATQLDPNTLKHLASVCAKVDVPLIICRSYGLLASLRLQVADHTIIESKPDVLLDDLRIANPFTVLQQHADSIDLQSLDSLEHSHVPYVVILLQLIQKWKKLHDGKTPSTFTEKDEFKAFIKSHHSENHAWGHEANFTEAHDNSYKAYVQCESDSTNALLCHEKSQNVSRSTSSSFWIMVHALRKFREVHGGALPLTGTVPDMTATTDRFIALQKVYQRQAAIDFTAFQQIVLETLESIDLPHDFISKDTMTLFCKNVGNIQAVQTRLLSQELEEPNLEELADDLMCCENPSQSPALWYCMLRSADLFFEQNGRRYPGCTDDSLIASDSEKLFEITTELCKKWKLLNSSTNEPYASINHAKEITRYGAVELHNVAALIGGMAAQEAVKVLTHQFVPLNNTYIYNGITGQAGVYDL